MPNSDQLDALAEFCAGLTWADVERERLAPLARARRERFVGGRHREMLAVHELNRQKARLLGVIGTDLDGPRRLAVAEVESAEYERRRVLAQKREAERKRRARIRAERVQGPRVQYTREQIDIAVAALARASQRGTEGRTA